MYLNTKDLIKNTCKEATRVQIRPTDRRGSKHTQEKRKRHHLGTVDTTFGLFEETMLKEW